jgi:cellulose synthase/poly-beta-1,6-N-acetylglucosamine synthase-like glycosyltransferase
MTKTKLPGGSMGKAFRYEDWLPENMSESKPVVRGQHVVENRLKFRFSVVMPVHNRGKYLRQTIDSVLSQTFTHYELITIDDGSTDESPEILSSYGSRLKVVRQAN